MERLPDAQTSVIEPEALDGLLKALTGRGFRVVGPTVRDGAIVYEDLESAAELPIGWKDSQDAGTYRLERREDEARFGYAVGPHSWKQFLLPARIRLWRAKRTDEGFEVEEEPLEDTPLALIGVRACELHGIAIQDRVFLGGSYADRDYAARRKDAFVVAVNCFEPAGTCFCVSMGTGPKAEAGYDLALTEILDGAHRLLVEVGTERGAEVLSELPHRAAGACRPRGGRRRGLGRGREDGPHARRHRHPRPARAQPRERALGRRRHALPHVRQLHARLPNLLLPHRRGPHRPDRRPLRADEVWDSCFTLDHSYIHGGSIRPSGRSRYRQWLTHKFGTWHDQFGSSGCVGCGRCIAWCPVGIDVTEELTAIRASEGADHADD